MTAQQLPASRPAGIELLEDPGVLNSYVSTQRGPCVRPLAIARPATEIQIEQLVAWANKLRIALVPVSSPGGPRRRGSTAPAVPAVVVDLSGLKRMIHADGRDAIAIIEPGLTFADFDNHLRSYGLRSMKPLLPRHNKSVLATFLEREPMIAMRDHWDTTDPLASLSITFGSGECFRTGGGSLPGSLQENLARGNRQMMASGPVMTDYTRVLLGSQGTLGIVGWASIYCERIPEREEAFFFGADDYAVLAELVRILALRQTATHCFMLDRVQAAAALGLPESSFSAPLPKWLLYATLTASDAAPDEKMDWQRRDLLALAAQAGAARLEEAYGFSAEALAARIQEPPQAFYKDAFGGTHSEVFCLTQMDRVPGLLDAVGPLLSNALQQGIAAGVYVQPTIQGTSCHLDFTLFHDTGKNDAATAISEQMVRKLAASGGFLSRPYGDWSQVAFGRDPNIVPLLRKVKRMFDPNNVLNPNRLCF